MITFVDFVFVYIYLYPVQLVRFMYCSYDEVMFGSNKKSKVSKKKFARENKNRLRFCFHERLNSVSALQYTDVYYCIGRPIHCNHYVGHYSGFSGISRSILNRFAPNLQA